MAWKSRTRIDDSTLWELNFQTIRPPNTGRKSSTLSISVRCLPKTSRNLRPTKPSNLSPTVTRQLELARVSLASGGQERFRRLNRYEYRNTIRDLLGVNTDSFDPTTSFPADDRVDGFDNIGESLVLSDYLLQCYLEAASRSIDKAVQSRAVVEPIDELLRPVDLSTTQISIPSGATLYRQSNR